MSEGTWNGIWQQHDFHSQRKPEYSRHCSGSAIPQVWEADLTTAIVIATEQEIITIRVALTPSYG